MIEYIVIILCIILSTIVLKFLLHLKISDIKRIVKFAKEENKLQENMQANLKSDEEIGKGILTLLGNSKTKVKINDNEKSDTCMYVVMTDTVWVSNVRDKITRIQTIAHECIHSIQDRAVLMFQYIFTNLYILYFIVSFILILLPIFKEQYVPNILLDIFIFLSIIHISVRIYLENDAMIRARYLAKEYMEKEEYKEEEISKIIRIYDDINPVGMKLYDYQIVTADFLKILILAILCLIKTL